MRHKFWTACARWAGVLVIAPLLSFGLELRTASPEPLRAQLIEVRKIWDEGRHNAFTDLLWWSDRWWCTFREGDAHVGGDGAIRILTSADGVHWESVARLSEKGVDLRDPKLTVMPSGKLMLNCGGSVYEGRTLKAKQSRVMFSSDGRSWTRPEAILAPGDWLWRVTWHGGMAYGAVYSTMAHGSGPGAEWDAAIYRSTDGVKWDLVKKLEVKGRPNETTLRFDSNGDMIALVRREAGDRRGHVGRASPPYTTWKWQESSHRFGGQNLIALPDGTWVVGTRDTTDEKPGSGTGARTMLAILREDGKLDPLLTLPSGGDTSYPGLVWKDGALAVSYYSSHAGKSAIYFARVRIDSR